jgi:hypothetical protein
MRSGSESLRLTPGTTWRMTAESSGGLVPCPNDARPERPAPGHHLDPRRHRAEANGTDAPRADSHVDARYQEPARRHHGLRAPASRRGARTGSGRTIAWSSRSGITGPGSPAKTSRSSSDAMDAGSGHAPIRRASGCSRQDHSRGTRWYGGSTIATGGRVGVCGVVPARAQHIGVGVATLPNQ